MTQPNNSGFTNITSSLRGRVQSGGILVFSGYGLSQMMRLASNLILTRLLMPEVFGLMAAAVSVSVLAIMVTDIGVNSSIIRSENAEKPEFLWTAWTIKIIRNMVIWAIVVLFAVMFAYLAASGATPAESVFSNPQLPWVMALTGAQLGISAFESVNRAMASRRLMMVRTVSHEVAVQLFTTIVTITAAFAGYGVWSFVMGLLSGAAFSVVLSYMIYPGPPMRLHIDKEHFAEIFGFGKWLVLASFFGFMTNKGDHFIFGWAMDDGQFGLYAIASIWISLAFHMFELVSKNIFYPAISEVMRERPHNVPMAYQQVRLLLDAGAVAAAFGIFFFADFALALLYPEGFGGISYYLKLLSPIVLLTPYRMINYVILSKGQSKKFTLVTFSTGLATLVLVPLMISTFGVQAGVIIFACIASASLPVAWSIVAKIMPVDWRVEGRMVIAILVLVWLLLGVEPPVA